jgi:hypothetical protein
MNRQKRVRFTKAPDKRGVWFETPYDEGWIKDLKIHVPWEHRSWDRKARMWWVSARWAKEAFQLCQDAFGSCFHVPDRKVPQSPVTGYAGYSWEDLDSSAYDDKDFEDLVDDLVDGPPPGAGRRRKSSWAGGRKSRDNRSHRKRSQRSSYRPPPPRSPLSEAYRTLQVAEDAPWELIRAAHKALARVHHPDFGGDTERMKSINAAFDTLKAAVGGR